MHSLTQASWTNRRIYAIYTDEWTDWQTNARTVTVHSWVARLQSKKAVNCWPLAKSNERSWQNPHYIHCLKRSWAHGLSWPILQSQGGESLRKKMRVINKRMFRSSENGTRNAGYNVVADGWTGAYNPPTHKHNYTHKTLTHQGGTTLLKSFKNCYHWM